MSRTNKKNKEWHETCKCKFRLDAGVFNNKWRWNKYNCRFVCKELIDNAICDKEFILNPSNCECECDKSCDVGEYLDYKNCRCRKKLVDKLREECTENIDEYKNAKTTLAEYENVCKYSFLHKLCCIFFNNFYNQHWNWYLFCLL